MKLIVGLGNIGKKYEDTRHNFGFMTLDLLAQRHKTDFKNSAKFKGEWGYIDHVIEEKVFLLKPHTFMNLSGESVRAFMGYFKIPSADLLVVFDHLDLGLGAVRMTRKGGDGGHRGMQSIITQLGSQDFPRIKLGIGRPQYENGAVVDHVLNRFTPAEQKIVNEVLDHTTKAIDSFLQYGIDKAMCQFNRKTPDEGIERKEK